MKLAEIENVVRVIFPLTMMREGELLPAAFRLREKKDGAEQYLSVFRQFASTFHEDILQFDKGRNLPCCIMNVGEVNAIKLTIVNKRVTYRVRAVPTSVAQSHAGIFVHIGDVLLEGSGVKTFDTLNVGEDAPFYILAIRRKLLNIAKRKMTVVGQLTMNNVQDI